MHKATAEGEFSDSPSFVFTCNRPSEVLEPYTGPAEFQLDRKRGSVRQCSRHPPGNRSPTGRNECIANHLVTTDIRPVPEKHPSGVTPRPAPAIRSFRLHRRPSRKIAPTNRKLLPPPNQTVKNRQFEHQNFERQQIMRIFISNRKKRAASAAIREIRHRLQPPAPVSKNQPDSDAIPP